MSKGLVIQKEIDRSELKRKLHQSSVSVSRSLRVRFIKDFAQTFKNCANSFQITILVAEMRVRNYIVIFIFKNKVSIFYLFHEINDNNM